jgi:DNA repair/transcription protein MET18/MMS19
MVVLKKLGKGFIEGFVGMMASEKDPHNLMLAFSILKVILVEFDIVGTQEVKLPSSILI